MKINFFSSANSSCGYTLSELIITIFIISVLTSIAIPGFTKWLPGYKLRIAAQELYSNIHHAKMLAIKENISCRLVFAPDDNGYYIIERNDGSIERTVFLNRNGDSIDIRFGSGDAEKAANTSGGTAPEDGISYSYNKATFNSRGLGKSGYVYLCNRNGGAYAVGTWASGVIILKKWNKLTDSWER